MKKTILISCALVAVFSLTAYGFVNIKKQQNGDTHGCVKVETKGDKALCAKPDKEEKAGCVAVNDKKDKGLCAKPKKEDKNDAVINDLIDQALLDKAQEKQNVGFTYRVGSRFNTTITKSELISATSIYDIYPSNATEDKQAFNDNKLAFLADGGNISAYGQGINFTEEQKQLLQTMDYSDNFYLHVDCSHKIGDSGYSNEEYIIYYITIIPEKEAEYKNGATAFIDYIKAHSRDYIQNLDSKKLRPGKVAFDVNTKGKIQNVNLEHTSGYDAIDQRMIDIINNVPGQWTPAEDATGNPVNQTYVFDFGVVGC